MKNPANNCVDKSEEKSANLDSLKIVTEALRGLKFGTVKLIVQDGILVRLERTENRLVARC